MEAFIKNKNGESTLTINGNFYQVLDENFTSLFNAIANEIRILQELKRLFDQDEKAIETIIRIISKSFSSEDAVIEIHENMGISVMAAQYVLNMQLSELSNMHSKGIETRLAKFQAQINKLSSLFEKKNFV